MNWSWDRWIFTISFFFNKFKRSNIVSFFDRGSIVVISSKFRLEFKVLLEKLLYIYYRSREIFLPCIKINEKCIWNSSKKDMIDEYFIEIEETKAHRYVPNRYGRMITNMLEGSCWDDWCDRVLSVFSLYDR